MGDALISVAITPNGKADAVTRHETDGKEYFVEPCIEQMTMKDLLNNIKHSSKDSDSSQAGISEIGPSSNSGDICYLQSQNGNLYTPKDPEHCTNEFTRIRDDVPSDVPWANEALGQPPDAVNVWIGDERSKTSIHSDPYENIYTVIRGTKHFVLLPPTEGFLLAERLYPRAVYARRRQGGVANGGDSIQGQLPLELVPVPRREDDKQQQQQDNSDLIEDDKSSDDDDEEVFDPNMVSWASIDPTNLLSSAEHEKLLPNEFSKYARPIHVTLHEGEALYLPSGWWHHVSQSSSSSPSPSPSRSSPTSNDDDLLEQDQHRGGRGVCIALNWWYDMEMRGDRWVWLSALRRRPTRQEPAQQN